MVWTVVLEKTLESPLDCKVIKPVHPKGNQPWIFIGRIDFEAETPILWPPDAKSWFIWKDADAGKDWRREEKGTNRGGDGWMASPTQWAWVWVNSGSWQWTGRPGLLQSMASQRVVHNWATELNWTPCRTEDALEAAGPGMLSSRAQSFFRSHSQVRKRTKIWFLFLEFADSKGSKTLLIIPPL